LHRRIIDQLIEEDFKLVEKWNRLTFEQNWTIPNTVIGPLTHIYRQIEFCEKNKSTPWNKYTNSPVPLSTTPPSSAPQSTSDTTSYTVTDSTLSPNQSLSSYNPQNYDVDTSSITNKNLYSSSPHEQSLTTFNVTTRSNLSSIEKSDLEDLVFNLENVSKNSKQPPLIGMWLLCLLLSFFRQKYVVVVVVVVDVVVVVVVFEQRRTTFQLRTGFLI
jgi:hypothetical protein